VAVSYVSLDDWEVIFSLVHIRSIFSVILTFKFLKCWSSFHIIKFFCISYTGWGLYCTVLYGTAVECLKHCCKNSFQNDHRYYSHSLCDMSLPQKVWGICLLIMFTVKVFLLKKNPLLSSVSWTITLTNYCVLYWHHHHPHQQQQQKQHIILL